MRAELRNPKFDWTPERVELLKKLWQDGLSASRVAKELGGSQLSRNAVLGKIHRLGLPERPIDVKVRNWTSANRAKAQTQAKRQPGTPNKRDYNAHPREQKGACAKRRKSDISAGAVIQTAPEPPKIDVKAAFTGIGKRTTLTIALFGECRWPLECVEDEQTLCGETTLLEQVYCACHAKLARNQIQPKGGERDLARALRRYA